MCKIVPNKPEPTKIKHLLWGFELKLLTEIPAKSLDLCFCSFFFFFFYVSGDSLQAIAQEVRAKGRTDDLLSHDCFGQ